MPRCAIALAVAALTLVPARANAADFEPSGEHWTGLSSLVSLARTEHVPLTAPPRVDLSRLRAADGLLLVGNGPALSIQGLQSFLRAGGRAAVAADFQRGGADVLRWFRIELSDFPAGGLDAELERGNPALPIAFPRSQHPLCVGIDGIVTNHPRIVGHARLRPVLGFTAHGDDALVLTGRVGGGRLVAIADPSVLINNMQRFPGNRQFAKNLLHYLVADREGGRVVLASGATRVVGDFGRTKPRSPLDALNDAMRELASLSTPPLATRLGALVLLVAGLTVIALGVPRRSPYDARHLQPVRVLAGGFAGRMQLFEAGRANLLYPTLIYKGVLEAEVLRRLGSARVLSLREVMDRMQERGVPRAEVKRFKALMVQLDLLKREQDRPPAPPMVRAAAFHDIVARGEAVLACLRGESAASVTETRAN